MMFALACEAIHGRHGACVQTLTQGVIDREGREV